MDSRHRPRPRLVFAVRLVWLLHGARHGQRQPLAFIGNPSAGASPDEARGSDQELRKLKQQTIDDPQVQASTPGHKEWKAKVVAVLERTLLAEASGSPPCGQFRPASTPTLS